MYFPLCLRWYKQRSSEVNSATGIFQPEHFNIWNSFWLVLCVQRRNLREDIALEMLVCSLRCSSKIYLLVYSPRQGSGGAFSTEYKGTKWVFPLWLLIRYSCFHLICKVMQRLKWTCWLNSLSERHHHPYEHSSDIRRERFYSLYFVSWFSTRKKKKSPQD